MRIVRLSTVLLPWHSAAPARGDFQPITAARVWWSLVLLVVLGLLGGCAAIERNYEAALLLGDLRAGDGPSRLKDRAPEPVRETVGYEAYGRTFVADVYQPGEPARAVLMLMHGFSEEGKDDPRLTAVASTFARARFTVVVPDIESLRRFEVRVDNVEDVLAAFQYAQREGLVEGRPLGAAAFSYGVGPVMLAALEPDAREQVDFMVAIGGYYDIVEALGFVTTGWFREDGEWVYREPNIAGKWLVLPAYTHRLEDENDRRLLREIAERKMADPEADVEDLAQQLGPDGRAMYDLTVNEDPQRVTELVRRLPEDVRAELRALDLANEPLQELHARLLLIHGRDDDIVPPTHSMALAEAVGDEQADLRLVGGLYHVDIDPGLRDAWRLWRAAAALLRLRDG
ncbi:alpha/beta hydrolase [Ectothiorhodospiraceae bacterium 2226]|nr:alpha/beta hydrolase [Ectothiorhodospiraceae bacterium 2226]